MKWSYPSAFWPGMLASTIATAVFVHFNWNPSSLPLKPAPNLPCVSSEAYLSLGDSGVEADHYIYLYDLFGIGKRLRDADLLLIGTSHVQLGLSAGVLSKKLSAEAGHPIRVYNMGLQCEEGWGFISDVLKRNRVENKAVLIDLFNPMLGGTTDYGIMVRDSGSVQGLIRIGNSWISEWMSTLMYPYFLRFQPSHNNSGKLFDTQPFISLLIWRNWADGDTCAIWNPYLGFFYKKGDDVRIRLRDYPKADLDGTAFDPLIQSTIEKNHLRPILVDVPWGGVDLGKASSLAASLKYPYLPLSSEFIDTLHCFDLGHHLSDSSRNSVSEQLFHEFMDQKLLFLISSKDPAGKPGTGK